MEYTSQKIKFKMYTNGTAGEPGAAGVTPHIGENGNWWIGTEDTGIPAQAIILDLSNDSDIIAISKDGTIVSSFPSVTATVANNGNIIVDAKVELISVPLGFNEGEHYDYNNGTLTIKKIPQDFSEGRFKFEHQDLIKNFLLRIIQSEVDYNLKIEKTIINSNNISESGINVPISVLKTKKDGTVEEIFSPDIDASIRLYIDDQDEATSNWYFTCNKDQSKPIHIQLKTINESGQEFEWDYETIEFVQNGENGGIEIEYGFYQASDVPPPPPEISDDDITYNGWTLVEQYPNPNDPLDSPPKTATDKPYLYKYTWTKYTDGTINKGGVIKVGEHPSVFGETYQEVLFMSDASLDINKEPPENNPPSIPANKKVLPNTWYKIEEGEALPVTVIFDESKGEEKPFRYTRIVQKYEYPTNTLTATEPVLDMAIQNVVNWCSTNNSTLIDGGNIYAGTVSAGLINTNALVSTNYKANSNSPPPYTKENGKVKVSSTSLIPLATNNPNRFSTEGTFFNLENGNIYSENFSIVGGDAYFRGTGSFGNGDEIFLDPEGRDISEDRTKIVLKAGEKFMVSDDGKIYGKEAILGSDIINKARPNLFSERMYGTAGFDFSKNKGPWDNLYYKGKSNWGIETIGSFNNAVELFNCYNLPVKNKQWYVMFFTFQGVASWPTPGESKVFRADFQIWNSSDKAWQDHGVGGIESAFLTNSDLEPHRVGWAFYIDPDTVARPTIVPDKLRFRIFVDKGWANLIISELSLYEIPNSEIGSYGGTASVEGGKIISFIDGTNMPWRPSSEDYPNYVGLFPSGEELTWFIDKNGCNLVNDQGISAFSATNGHVQTTGEIMATGGVIGGWIICDNELHSDGNRYSNIHKHYITEDNKICGSGMQPPGSGAWSFAAGYTNYESWSTAKFKVKHDGSLYIGGDGENTPFRVTSGGAVYCSDLEYRNSNIAGNKTYVFTTYDNSFVFQADSNYSSGTQRNRLSFAVSGDYTGLENSSFATIGASNTKMGTGSSSNNAFIAFKRYGLAQGVYPYGTSGNLYGSWYGSDSKGISSDQRVKSDIEALNDKYSILFDNLRPVSYKYNSGTSGRLHTGFIAQEVDGAMQKATLSRLEFAALEILNYNEPEELQEWYLRYEEFVALNTDQIQKLKPRMSAAEQKLLDYEARIAYLEQEVAALKQ